MKVDRREVFNRLAVAGTTLLAVSDSARAYRGPFKAVAFDAFPIFNPQPIFGLAEEMFPGRGVDLADLWRTRQFEYTWLRTMSRRYADFEKVTNDALVFASKELRIDMTVEKQARLAQAYFHLQCWPDVPPALHALKDAGLRLAFLSNMTVPMLQAGIQNSGLDGVFDHILSTDRVRAYKPDPRAYQMGLDFLRLKRQEILFAAFAGWDMAGAKAFGYPTFWVNRQHQRPEELGVAPDGTGRDLNDLVSFALS